jgi:hypothetical protein
MDRRAGDNAARKLERANEYQDKKWRLWSYVPVEETLVLRGSDPEGRYGFLFFTIPAISIWMSGQNVDDVTEMSPSQLLALVDSQHARRIKRQNRTQTRVRAAGC